MSGEGNSLLPHGKMHTAVGSWNLRQLFRELVKKLGLHPKH
jgi:hypothetical protein